MIDMIVVEHSEDVRGVSIAHLAVQGFKEVENLQPKTIRSVLIPEWEWELKWIIWKDRSAVVQFVDDSILRIPLTN